jgi:hypothetical protein
VSAFKLLRKRYGWQQKNLAGTIHLSGFADFEKPCNTNINRIRSMAFQYYRVYFILATLILTLPQGRDENECSWGDKR